MHLIPKPFFRQIEFTYYSKHLDEKNFEFGWILDFLCPFKVAHEVLDDRVFGSLGRRLLLTSTLEPNTMAPQWALCICSRKGKAKLFVPRYIETKISRFCFRIIFFVTGDRVKFRFARHEINFDRAPRTTVNLLLRTRREENSRKPTLELIPIGRGLLAANKQMTYVLTSRGAK